MCVFVCIHVCACMFVCVYMHACVCVSERERERERECVWVGGWVGKLVCWCWEFLVCLFACLARPVYACAYRCLLTPTGITYVQQTAYKGQRASTSRSFLHPVLNRLNLHVTVNSFVTKVSSVASSFSSFFLSIVSLVTFVHPHQSLLIYYLSVRYLRKAFALKIDACSVVSIIMACTCFWRV